MTVELTPKHIAKFPEFIKAMAEDAELIIIYRPEVLGDNYEELITNMNLIAQSEKKLAIVSPSKRRKR